MRPASRSRVPDLHVRSAVATCRLMDRKSDRLVRLRIFAPCRSKRAWVCRFEMESRAGHRSGRAFGTTSVQALFLVFQAIRNELEPGRYTDIHGSPAELDFPRFVVAFDLQTLVSAERSLENRMKRYVRRADAQRRGAANVSR